MLPFLLAASLLTSDGAFMRSKGVVCWIENPDPAEVTSVIYRGAVLNDTASGAGSAVWMNNEDTVLVYEGAFLHGRHIDDKRLFRIPPRGSKLSVRASAIFWDKDTLVAKEWVPDPQGMDKLEPPADIDVPPQYDAQALRATIDALALGSRSAMHGTCIVAVHVLADGTVDKTDVVKRVNATIDNITVESILRQSFTPAKKGGKAVTAWFRIEMRYD